MTKKIFSLALLVALLILPTAKAAETRSFTASINKTEVLVNSTNEFSILITNTSDKAQIKHSQIRIPTSFTLNPSSVYLSPSAPSNWTPRISVNEIFIGKSTSGKDFIEPGESFEVFFTATAKDTPGTYPIDVRSYKNNGDGIGGEFTMEFENPTITIKTAPTGPTLVYKSGSPSQNLNNSPDISITVSANSFSLLEAAALKSIKFWTVENPPATFSGNYGWEIYADNAGVPGNSLFSGTASGPNVSRTQINSIPSGVPGFDYAEYENNIDIGTISLPAGIYWLGIHNGPLNIITTFQSSYWETTTPPATTYSYSYLPPFGTIAPNWFSNAGTLAFELYK